MTFRLGRVALRLSREVNIADRSLSEGPKPDVVLDYADGSVVRTRESRLGTIYSMPRHGACSPEISSHVSRKTDTLTRSKVKGTRSPERLYHLIDLVK